MQCQGGMIVKGIRQAIEERQGSESFGEEQENGSRDSEEEERAMWRTGGKTLKEGG